MYQSGDTIMPGSSHAMLVSADIDGWEEHIGTDIKEYFLPNGSWIEVTRTISPVGIVTLGAKFFDSAGIERTSYGQGNLGFREPDILSVAICMQWFERDGVTYIGFNYFTYGSTSVGNTGFAPESWISVPREQGMYNNPTGSYVGPSVYGEDESPGNPYSPGGTTEQEGGGGTFHIINDDIDFPTPPTASAANANFISIWTPTLDQVQNLAKWLWNTDPTKWNFWQKLLQNPLELIFSLSIMPIPIHHTDEGGTPTSDELIANADVLALGWQSTGLKMDWVTQQYVTLDMGTINLEEVWGAFLDYDPYTKIDIYLPYIGVKQLDTNDCMPREITLRYVIDLATGTCVAMIKCDNSVYYHFSGNCASQIPITVNQCQEIVRGLMTMVVGAASIGIGGAVGAGAHASKAAIAKGAAMKAGGAAMVGSGANEASKGVNVSRSGTVSCAAGLMGVQTPYLIISRPRQAMPKDQQEYTGYPSFMTKMLGDLTGYTEIQSIHLENMTCTDDEYEEINVLLAEGVII